MKQVFLFLAALSICLSIQAQYKVGLKIIDSSTYGKWPVIENESISNNGSLVSYNIINYPLNESTFVVQSVDRKYYREFKGIKKFMFSENSRCAFVLLDTNDLLVISIEDNRERLIKNVSDFFLCSSDGNTFCYQLNEEKKITVIVKGEKKSSLIDYEFVELAPNKHELLLRKSPIGDSSILYMLNTENLKQREIWRGRKFMSNCFNDWGDQLAFSIDDGDGKTSIWHYNKSMRIASKLIDGKLLYDLSSKFIFPSDIRFNKSGDQLLLTLYKKHNNSDSLKSNAFQSANVLTNRSVAIRDKNSEIDVANEYFKSILNVKTKQLIRIEDEIISPGFDYLNNVSQYTSHFLFGFSKVNEKLWFEPNPFPQLVIINSQDGKCDVISRDITQTANRSISPDGSFAVWFDWDSLGYISYETNTGKRRCLTSNTRALFYDSLSFVNTHRKAIYGLKGDENTIRWVNGGAAFIVYDRFDLWLIDPKGNQRPQNITNSYGMRNGIVFTLLDCPESKFGEISKRNDHILLVGYNIRNKRNGFWKLNEIISDPVMLTMEDYNYYLPRISEAFKYDINHAEGFRPIKAKNCNRWLVKRMSCVSYPNLLVTNDFMDFSSLTNLNPQSGYNWLKSELVTWQLNDSTTANGILYKPCNFDSTKSYPVIFNYYVRKSDELCNEFLFPKYTRANIDIPTFVSNGFLVFIPDIYYKSEKNGESVSSYVESAAHELCKRSWIDSTKLGLQGHSFGGWATNYLLTHSTMWAAACEVAGASDLVSAYGQINFDATSDRQFFYETFSQGSAFGLGVTPYNKPQSYINNSPVFHVGKIETPLLMMHNKEDRSVPYSQAIEMFLALRRAGKKVWFLRYENEDHILMNNKNAMDFTNKLLSFFGHYLKGEKLPDWMVMEEPNSVPKVRGAYQINNINR